MGRRYHAGDRPLRTRTATHPLFLPGIIAGAICAGYGLGWEAFTAVFVGFAFTVWR